MIFHGKLIYQQNIKNVFIIIDIKGKVESASIDNANRLVTSRAKRPSFYNTRLTNNDTHYVLRMYRKAKNAYARNAYINTRIPTYVYAHTYISNIQTPSLRISPSRWQREKSTFDTKHP